MSNSTNLIELADTAEAAVAELEALKPGAWVADDARSGTPAPWADAEDTALKATDALHAEAVAMLFPDRVQPIGGDLLADLDHYSALTGFRGEALAELHGRAVETYPSLAALIRSAHILDRVRRANRGPSTTDRDLAAEAVAALVDGVAEQLIYDADLGDAATAIAATLPALSRRVASEVARCEGEATARSRSELAGFFRQNWPSADRPVQIGSERLPGAAIAERIEAGDEAFIDLARHRWEHHPEGGGRSNHGHALYA